MRSSAMANFTQGYFIDAGSISAVLLEPTGNTSEAEDVHCLGLCILQGRPSWRGLRILGDETILNGLTEWKDDIIRRFKTTLYSADILGGIIAFGGKYELDSRIFKGLVEAWCSETNTFIFLMGILVSFFGISGYYEGQWLQAAFLSLWLCKFIMPSGQRDTIRPEVFVMASKLGEGLRVALAPAVLCSIQVALGHMASNLRGPSNSNYRFPIHFLATWIHSHFRGTCTGVKFDAEVIRVLNRMQISEIYFHAQPYNPHRCEPCWKANTFVCSLVKEYVRAYFSSGIDSLVENELNPKKICKSIPRSLLVEPQRGVCHDHSPLIDAKAIAANPQDIAPHEIEDSIPSRYNPEVDYELTPSVSKDNLDSPQNTIRTMELVGEEISNENLVGEEIDSDNLAGEEIYGKGLNGEENDSEKIDGKKNCTEGLIGKEICREELVVYEFAGEEFTSEELADERSPRKKEGG
uniref:Aminotransferase-like plant mobile domain-containing protein n=1 Tax=Ananas comosus var. bracteatus TaxID=296719 RepID=A0A6V7P4G8_ANACO|nr:unnamed protein product [Ananas comosus var. bracteatus]